MNIYKFLYAGDMMLAIFAWHKCSPNGLYLRLLDAIHIYLFCLFRILDFRPAVLLMEKVLFICALLNFEVILLIFLQTPTSYVV